MDPFDRMGSGVQRRQSARSLAEGRGTPAQAGVRDGADPARDLELSEWPRHGVTGRLRHAGLRPGIADSGPTASKALYSGRRRVADRSHRREPTVSRRALPERCTGWLCGGPALAGALHRGGRDGATLAGEGPESQSNELAPKATYSRAPEGLNSKCPGSDSNRDALRHCPLKTACLPVSPPGRAQKNREVWL